MSISLTGIQAYQSAMSQFKKAQNNVDAASTAIQGAKGPSEANFSDTLRESLGTVNEMQTEKRSMIQSFASGENQNVHELMITMQKAGLAINMTTAVRNKVMEAYKELSRIQF